jgi:hypothetical protein
MCIGRIPEHVRSTALSIEFDQGTLHDGTGKRSHTPHMYRADQTYWTRLQWHFVFGDINANPTICSVSLRNTLLLTQIGISKPTKDLPPTHSEARILRRCSMAFFDNHNARILHSKIGHIQAWSVCLIIDFSETDQLGLGRLLIHCRQDEPNVICVVSIMENWIAMTRDTFHLSEEGSV